MRKGFFIQNPFGVHFDRLDIWFFGYLVARSPNIQSSNDRLLDFFGIGNVNTSIFRHLKKCGDRYAIPMCRQTFIVLLVCIAGVILCILPTDPMKESSSCFLELACKSKPNFQPVGIAIRNIYSLLFDKRYDTLDLGSGVFACVGVCRWRIACVAVLCVRRDILPFFWWKSFHLLRYCI